MEHSMSNTQAANNLADKIHVCSLLGSFKHPVTFIGATSDTQTTNQRCIIAMWLTTVEQRLEWGVMDPTAVMSSTPLYCHL